MLAALAEAGDLPPDPDIGRITCEPPRDAGHGDLATNAALVLAKAAGAKPRELAAKIAEGLRRLDSVAAVEVAGPGFINIRVADRFWQDRVGDILSAGTAYGDADIGRGEEAVNVEFTSANPTGPLHVAHARGAVFGDALAALLEKAGYAVTREYYVNDWGGQVDILAESLLKRMRQLQGEAVPEAEFEGLYPGREVIDAAKAALKLPPEEQPDPASGSRENLGRARQFAVAYMMDRIRGDLAALGVRHDVFASERALVEAGAVDAAFADLEGRGLIYTGVLEPPKGKLPDDWEERPQSLFRATQFGDDIDRPLKKSNGDWTYFATDIAYHLDKAKRGAVTLIDVWGADHQGYIPRMKAAVAAITGGRGHTGCQGRPARPPDPRRDGGENVQAGRRCRDGPRCRERGRQGCRPLRHADAPERCAAGFRFRQGDRAVEGQPGLLCPICSRARAFRVPASQGSPAPIGYPPFFIAER